MLESSSDAAQPRVLAPSRPRILASRACRSSPLVPTRLWPRACPPAGLVRCALVRPRAPPPDCAPPARHDARRSTLDARRSTHDARRTTHDARRSRHHRAGTCASAYEPRCRGQGPGHRYQPPPPPPGSAFLPSSRARRRVRDALVLHPPLLHGTSSATIAPAPALGADSVLVTPCHTDGTRDGGGCCAHGPPASPDATTRARRERDASETGLTRAARAPSGHAGLFADATPPRPPPAAAAAAASHASGWNGAI